MNIKPKKNNKKKKILKNIPVEIKVTKNILEKENKEVESKHSYLELPIKDIKLDLVGMLFFAGASLLAILLLKKYDVNLDTITTLFQR